MSAYVRIRDGGGVVVLSTSGIRIVYTHCVQSYKVRFDLLKTIKLKHQKERGRARGPDDDSLAMRKCVIAFNRLFTIMTIC